MKQYHLNKSGFSLIELLLALLVSSIGLSAIISININYQKFYKTLENLTDLKQNLRAGIYYIER
ncbi:MAG: prepilin-type N-terminal cleavage/methylation domain-containing protein, partial [bacterium]|nr:prepilin-type N-terminal cleavage/methylation domain-containing protein [bacterium]